MREPRIFHSQAIKVNAEVSLETDAANHVGRVLRMVEGEPLKLFNGDGSDYSATIIEASKKSVRVLVTEQQPLTNESPLSIHLFQAISRGDKMDFTIQKSVELGVTEITPIFTERCGVKLSGERLQKRQLQWQKVAISACEQSGRARVPKVHNATTLAQCLAQETEQLKLNLHPKASQSLKSLSVPEQGVRFIIGPEGGLSESEIEQAAQAGYQNTLLGPRVLRTETAALSLISTLQFLYGDLA